jgi:ATPase subunit of ABC transporter with duplicated ATPase domains
MLTLHEVAYRHPNKELLFNNLNFSILKHEKIALIGNNGVGKSTLLQILAGIRLPTSGTLKVESTPYIVPQIFGQFNKITIGEALGLNEKLIALHSILNGDLSADYFTTLSDDWDIEDRCSAALANWNLNTPLTTEMGMLSGGQKTAVFLAGIEIHRPDLILLDEPTNHLDSFHCALLYDLIKTTKSTLVTVSHDHTLLNLLQPVYEIEQQRIRKYGGNYAFYLAQKELEVNELANEVQHKEQALKKAKEVERTTMQRQQKLDSRGKKKQDKAGLPTIVKNALKNNAEKSTSNTKAIHATKVKSLIEALTQQRESLASASLIKINLKSPDQQRGKLWLTATNINLSYNDQPIWEQSLNFQLFVGERIMLSGKNGSGKTTLIKLILGQLQPSIGTLLGTVLPSIYIDQEYTLINNELTVYEQAEQFDDGHLASHEIKLRLNRFLFPKDTWSKSCHDLSGGEKMRLLLSSITICRKAPGLIVLDEPTNNLDRQNIEILISAIASYQGTILAVSHDAYFLEQININRKIQL